MTAAGSTADRYRDHRSRAQQVVAALIRDLQQSLSRLNPLRSVEIPPAVVDRGADRVLALLREVSHDAAQDAARAVLQELLAELDDHDLAVIRRTGTTQP